MTHGLCRHYAGDFMEEATSQLTGATRLKTDSRSEVCPDLWLTDEEFFECKSVGRTDEAILYEPRWLKDKRFCGRGDRSLHYWFWHHTYRVSAAQTQTELWNGMAAALVGVTVVGLDEMDGWLHGRTSRLLNNAYLRAHKKSNGYGSPQYGYGWNFPLTVMRGLCDGSRMIPEICVYGVPVRNVLVRFGKTVPLWIREII